MRILSTLLILIGLFSSSALAAEIFLAEVTHVDTEQQQVMVQLLSAADNGVQIPVDLTGQQKVLAQLSAGALVRLWGVGSGSNFQINRLLLASSGHGSSSRLKGVRSRMSHGRNGSASGGGHGGTGSSGSGGGHK